MSDWDNLWGSDKDLCSTAEIMMQIPDFVIRDWLHKVKAEGDKLQETVLFLRETVKALADIVDSRSSGETAK